MNLPTEFYAPTARIIGSTTKILSLFTNYLFYHVTYQRVWYRSEWGVISVSFPGRQRCQNDPYRCMGPWANAVAFIGHLPTKMSDMLPTIYLPYQRVWYRSEWGVISISLPGMQRCQNDPYRSIGTCLICSPLFTSPTKRQVVGVISDVKILNFYRHFLVFYIY